MTARARQTTAKWTTVILMAAAAVAVAAPREDEWLEQIDRLLPQMGAENIEDRKAGQLELEKHCFTASAPGQRADRRALCRAMAQRLGPDVPMPARVWMLRKLEPIGRAEVVAPLTLLLSDDDDGIRELARRALQNNPSDKAAAALRAELGKSGDDAWRVALINALAFRRDADSVPALGTLAGAPSDAVAAAAVSALACIGGDPAADAIEKLAVEARPALRDELVNARLRIAEDLVERGKRERATAIYRRLAGPGQPERIRIAALHGLARSEGAAVIQDLLKVLESDDARMRLVAVRLAEEIPGRPATSQLAAALPDAPPPVQAGLLEALGRRGDDTALQAVRSYVEAPDEQVRIAALGAIAQLGGAPAIGLLVERAARTSGLEQVAARDGLARLKGEGVDRAILSALDGAKGAARAELIRAAAARRVRQAKPAFLAAVADTDQTIRLAGIIAVAECETDGADLPAILGLLEDVDGVMLGLGDEAIEREVATALLRLAKRAGASHASEASAALDQLRQATGDDGLRAQIETALDQLATYCLAWQVSGPYRAEGKKGSDLIDVPFAPEEDAGAAQWRALPVTNPDNPGLFELGNDHECCAYVRTTLFVNGATDAQLLIGSDDGVKIWLNGKVVHTNNVSRGVTPGQDKVPVTLKEGPNQLMLKITQGGGGWGVCCQVKAADGSRLEGLQFKAE